MSLGATFVRYPAHFGGILEVDAVPNACAAATDAGVPGAGAPEARAPRGG